MDDGSYNIDYIIEQLHARRWLDGKGKPDYRFGVVSNDIDELLYEYINVVIGEQAYNLALPARRLPYATRSGKRRPSRIQLVAEAE